VKRVKIDIQDLLMVLNAMVDSAGTTDVIFFEHNSLPALADASDPDNIITFETFDDTQETKDGDAIH
jgi:hypothetical protein